MMVKVCGLTRRDDAQVAVDAGASAIGFVFYPKSPRYIQPERAAVIGEDLKVWKVGIFVDETARAIERIAQTARLDVAQIYLNQTYSIAYEFPKEVRIWRAERVVPLRPDQHHHRLNLEWLSLHAEAILLDGQKNGSGFDWALGRDAKRKVIVAGGLDASNVAEAICISRPWGVDASSKLETSPGVKDHEKVKAFVAAALRAGKEFAC
jgi:phosphoribosylanthranilate isomerase